MTAPAAPADFPGFGTPGVGTEDLPEQARAARRAGDRATALRHTEAALAQAPDRRDLRTEQGYDLLELGRAEAAEAVFRALDAEQPGEADVMIGLGRALRAQGNHLAALLLFEAGLALVPKKLGARLDVGYALLDVGRPADADPVFAAILTDHPGQSGALFGRARVARRSGEWAAAVEFVEAILKSEPGNAAARLQAANDLVELGRMEEAEAHCRQLLQRAPRHIEASLLLGRILRRLDQRAEAAELFARVVAARPSDIGARIDLGYEEIERGDLAAAERLFRGVLAEQPRQGGAHVGLSRVARSRGDRAATRAHLAAAVAADPENVGAHLELAADLREWGEIDAARPLIEAAYRASPGSLEVLLHRGDLQRHAGEDEAALATYTEAARLHPLAVRPLVEAAVQARTLGDPAAAADWLAQALRLQPGHPDALAHQADLAWVAEDYDRCLAICEQALGLHPDRLWPYVTAARARAALGEWLEGVSLLERATAALGPQAEITAGRIELLKPRGAWPQVRAVLDGAAAEIAGSFRLWVERVQCDIAYGKFAAAEAMLAAPPATSARDLARVAMLRGYIAEARWNLEEAVGHYREALRLSPSDPGMHNELARADLLRLDLDGAGEHNAISVRLNATAARLRRESLSPAQTHLGQVLDEYRMDRAATDMLAKLSERPAAERIAPLRAFVRRNPGHTPAAICLVLALRQAGLFADHTLAAPGHAAIPRRLLQFWDAPEPPPDLMALMATWRENNPAWTYERFHVASAQEFLTEHYGREVLAAFRRARHPAHKADLFRLAWLHVNGGVYVDADDRCLAPLEAVLPPGRSFLGYQEGFSTISNNVLGAAPGHPVIARAFYDAVEALNRGDSDSLWLSTGPGLITRSFATELALSPMKTELWLRGVCVLERYELLQSVAVHCFARYKTTKNNWKRAAFAAPADAG